MDFIARSKYFLLFSFLLSPNFALAAADDASPIMKKTFKFFKDTLYRTASLSIKANGEESNANIDISVTSNIPKYTVFPPIGFTTSMNAQEALEKAKKQYPKWDPVIITVIETFFKEFSSPEQIEKGIEWQNTTRLKKLGKKAYQDFDAEVDAITRCHNQHISDVK